MENYMTVRKKKPRPSVTRAESIRRTWAVKTIRQARTTGVRRWYERARAALDAQERGDGVAEA